MSTEENKAIVRRYIEEVLNAGDLAIVDEVMALTVASHYTDRTDGDLNWSPEKEREWNTWVRSVFSDAHYTIEDLIAEGDKVNIRTTWRATHKGEFAGIAPTGKQVSATGIFIFRITAGRIAEEWGNFDMHGLLQQLGADPTTAK